MVESGEVENSGTKFSQVLDAAAKLPGVRINRAAYPRKALKRYCTDEQIDRAIAQNPAAAGISPEVIKEVANTSIGYETSKEAFRGRNRESNPCARGGVLWRADAQYLPPDVQATAETSGKP